MKSVLKKKFVLPWKDIEKVLNKVVDDFLDAGQGLIYEGEDTITLDLTCLLDRHLPKKIMKKQWNWPNKIQEKLMSFERKSYCVIDVDHEVCDDDGTFYSLYSVTFSHILLRNKKSNKENVPNE